MDKSAKKLFIRDIELVEKFLNQLNSFYGVSFSDLNSDKKSVPIPSCRKFMFWYLFHELNYSKKEIVAIFPAIHPSWIYRVLNAYKESEELDNDYKILLK